LSLIVCDSLGLRVGGDVPASGVGGVSGSVNGGFSYTFASTWVAPDLRKVRA
jgi:hypothetical protein